MQKLNEELLRLLNQTFAPAGGGKSGLGPACFVCITRGTVGAAAKATQDGLLKWWSRRTFRLPWVGARG